MLCRTFGHVEDSPSFWLPGFGEVNIWLLCEHGKDPSFPSSPSSPGDWRFCTHPFTAQRVSVRWRAWLHLVGRMNVESVLPWNMVISVDLELA